MRESQGEPKGQVLGLPGKAPPTPTGELLGPGSVLPGSRALLSLQRQDDRNSPAPRPGPLEMQRLTAAYVAIPGAQFQPVLHH